MLRLSNGLIVTTEGPNIIVSSSGFTLPSLTRLVGTRSITQYYTSDFYEPLFWQNFVDFWELNSKDQSDLLSYLGLLTSVSGYDDYIIELTENLATY